MSSDGTAPMVPRHQTNLPDRARWATIADRHRVVAAATVLGMRIMERHQNAGVRWLTEDEPPLALIFVSHRWETLDHPDPTGRQLRGLQRFLALLCRCVEAICEPAAEARRRLVPSLSREGALQAEELARRILGYGPFGDETSLALAGTARRSVREAFTRFQHDRPAFAEWLAARIGVWLDYTCMPQKPLAPAELPEFERAMAALGSLVMSSTVVTLRYDGDEYPTRGWCAVEYFLGSERSFSRGLFVDLARLERGEEVLVPAPPPIATGTPDTVAGVLREGYDNDRAAFLEACDTWVSSPYALIEVGAPDPWARYRDLQGSSVRTAGDDPNPFRPMLEALRGLETELIERWLLSAAPCTIDLGVMVRALFDRAGLQCRDPADVTYLGFLAATHGWIDAFRPLFRECLDQVLASAPSRRLALHGPVVTLQPIAEDDRARMLEGERVDAHMWHSRLAAGSTEARSEPIVERARRALAERPPQFALVGDSLANASSNFREPEDSSAL